MFKFYQDERKQFYQWDTNRKLIVEDDTVTQVHFCNRTQDCSVICDVYDLGGLRVVDIPDVLLEQSWTIRAYAYCGCYTKACENYKVQARTKPASRL